MRKLIFLFGIILVLLFMIPLVSMANMTTESPPAITNNGNEFTLVIATPDATVLTNVDGIINAGADLISAEIADMTTAQFTGINLASTTDKINASGQNVDGAIIMVTKNATTASSNGTPMTIAIILPVTDSNNTYSLINYGITLTNGSNGADAPQLKSEVAFVLKIEISSGANVNLDHGSAESVRALSDNVDLYGITVGRLKMPINIDANNTDTDAVLTPTTISMVNTAINTSTAFGTTRTIEYSIPQAGQKVRTLVNKNQAATYRMASAGVDATTAIDATTATEQIAMPALAMINSAANIYFNDITVTAMVQNQENAAYANDLVVAASVNNTYLVDAIADTARGRAPTYTERTFCYDIAVAGLVAPNFA